MPRCKDNPPDTQTTVTDERCGTTILCRIDVVIKYGTITIHVTIYSSRFGRCTAYTGGIEVCDGILTAGTDFVYIMTYNNNISAYLNDKINGSLFVDHRKDCVLQVFRIICHYFLPPCGNTTKMIPPSSVCQEECSQVQSSCQDTWYLTKLIFNSDQFISCEDTSELLYPLQHCCTGAGIVMDLDNTAES